MRYGIFVEQVCFFNKENTCSFRMYSFHNKTFAEDTLRSYLDKCLKVPDLLIIDSYVFSYENLVEKECL